MKNIGIYVCNKIVFIDKDYSFSALVLNCAAAVIFCGKDQGAIIENSFDGDAC